MPRGSEPRKRVGSDGGIIQWPDEIAGRVPFSGFRKRRPVRVTEENIQGMVRHMRRRLEKRPEGRAATSWLGGTVWDSATDASIPPGVVELADANGDRWRYPLAEFDVPDGERP